MESLRSTHPNRAALVAAVIACDLVLIGCNDKSDITVHGFLVAQGDQCFLHPGRYMAHKKITFYDSFGVIGTTTTGAVTRGVDPGSSPVCKETAPYSVSLPKVEFYRATVDGAGGNRVMPDPLSYSDLQRSGFRLDLTTGTSLLSN
jgi:hypothetical protein